MAEAVTLRNWLKKKVFTDRKSLARFCVSAGSQVAPALHQSSKKLPKSQSE